jgi:hypothetical protein
MIDRPAFEPAFGPQSSALLTRSTLSRGEPVHVLHVGWISELHRPSLSNEQPIDLRMALPDVSQQAVVLVSAFDVELELDRVAWRDQDEQRGPS